MATTDLGHLYWLWSGSPELLEARKIIAWWEYRRLAYNVFLATTGSVGLLAFLLLVTASGHLRAGEDAVEPMALLVAPILANIGYTLGWVVELVLRKAWVNSNQIGPALLRLGLGFSVLIIATPGASWLVHWVLSPRQ